MDTKKTTQIDVRDGKPFDERRRRATTCFRVDWSPDGDELTFLRTNRRQNVLEMAACAPSTGTCRVVIHEEWPTGWIDDDPAPNMQWLDDGNRFIWESERNGFKNYYLYDFKAGKLITPLTQLSPKSSAIVRVDETSNALYYMARDGDNYMKFQLHRVGLDGKSDKRLTDPAFTHTHLAVARREAFRGRRRDARPGAGDAPRRRERNGRRRAREHRPHEVRRARTQEGRDVHVSRRPTERRRCTA